jgi:flagellar biosynthetic protein FliP
MKQLIWLLVVLSLGGVATPVQAQTPTLPGVTIQLNPPSVSAAGEKQEGGAELSVNLQILLLFTVLAIAPLIVVMMTSFTRMVVVLSFVRQAIGTQQMPPAQLILGLALILSGFVMAPVFGQINSQALQPYLNDEITQSEALELAAAPLRTFMLKQTREQDLELFVELSQVPRPEGPEDIPLHVLVPGFVLSELRLAFQIGFVLFIPFLVIDMVVASVLMSMGMMMLPPVMVSLPFKILLFVLVDGWYLIVRSLVGSFA